MKTEIITRGMKGSNIILLAALIILLIPIGVYGDVRFYGHKHINGEVVEDRNAKSFNFGPKVVFNGELYGEVGENTVFSIKSFKKEKHIILED